MEGQFVLGLYGRYLVREITLVTVVRAKPRAKVAFVRNETWTPEEWRRVGGKSISQNSNLAPRFSRLKQNKLIIHSSSSMEFLLFYSSKSRSQVRILRQYVEHGLLHKHPLFGKGYEGIFPDSFSKKYNNS